MCIRDSDSMAALYAAPRAVLHAVWGSVAGSAMYAKLRGVPCALQTEPGLSLGHSHILPPAMRNPADALAVLQRLVHKAAMRLRRKQRYVSSLSIFVQTLHVLPDGKRVRDTQVRQAGLGQTCDTAFLLQATTQLWHSGLQWAPRPQAVGLQLRGLVAASGHTADLFDTLPHTVRTGSPPQTRLALYRAVDHLNAVYGKNTVYFASAQAGLDHAPMRIAFNRIPDLVSEQ